MDNFVRDKNKKLVKEGRIDFDQKRIHVGLITSFVTMLIYLDQGHLTWTVVGVVGHFCYFILKK
ncbi:hypothetical protein EfmJHP38_00230 [Enterococcus faecium]|nr:hypothetical protein EfmJHP38_00230 [Enterococcus faecium]